MSEELTLVLGSIESSACRRNTKREENDAFMRDGVELSPLEDLPTAIFSSRKKNANILRK